MKIEHLQEAARLCQTIRENGSSRISIILRPEGFMIEAYRLEKGKEARVKKIVSYEQVDKAVMNMLKVEIGAVQETLRSSIEI